MLLSAAGAHALLDQARGEIEVAGETTRSENSWLVESDSVLHPVASITSLNSAREDSSQRPMSSHPGDTGNSLTVSSPDVHSLLSVSDSEIKFLGILLRELQGEEFRFQTSTEADNNYSVSVSELRTLAPSTVDVLTRRSPDSIDQLSRDADFLDSGLASAGVSTTTRPSFSALRNRQFARITEQIGSSDFRNRFNQQLGLPELLATFVVTDRFAVSVNTLSPEDPVSLSPERDLVVDNARLTGLSHVTEMQALSTYSQPSFAKSVGYHDSEPDRHAIVESKPSSRSLDGGFIRIGVTISSQSPDAERAEADSLKTINAPGDIERNGNATGNSAHLPESNSQRRAVIAFFSESDSDGGFLAMDSIDADQSCQIRGNRAIQDTMVCLRQPQGLVGRYLVFQTGESTAGEHEYDQPADSRRVAVNDHHQINQESRETVESGSITSIAAVAIALGSPLSSQNVRTMLLDRFKLLRMKMRQLAEACR